MAQGGLLGNGMKVAYAIGSPQTWLAMTDLVDVVYPTWEGDQVEITTHSPTNRLRRRMAGLVTVGDPSITVLTDFDPATSPRQKALRDANRTGQSFWWRIEHPVNRERTLYFGIEFLASVKSYAPATPIDDKATIQFTLSFDGEDIYEDGVAGATQI